MKKRRQLTSIILLVFLTFSIPTRGYTADTPTARLKASFSAGQTAFFNQHYQEAEQDFSVAVENARALRNAQLFAVSCSYLGFSQVYLDKLEEAEITLKTADKVAAVPGITPVAKMLTLLAYIEYYSRWGDIGSAQKYIQATLIQDDAAFRSIGISREPLKQLYKSNQILEKTVADLSVPQQADNYAKDALLNGKVMHWNDETKTIRVYISSSSHIQGWDPEYAENFKKACLVWQSVLNNKVRFEFVNSENVPVDTVVTWYADKSIRPAITDISVYKGKLIKEDIAFHLIDNSNQLYEPRKIYKLSLHELGYLLGISGHSANPNDIMFPAATYANQPSARDAATLLELYSRPAQITNPSGKTLSEYRQEVLSRGKQGDIFQTH